MLFRSRAHGISADRAYENKSMKSQMKAADRSGAAFAIIVGTNELDEGTVVVRPLRAESASQHTVSRTGLIDHMKKAMS